jgi:hypothetical protein
MKNLALILFTFIFLSTNLNAQSTFIKGYYLSLTGDTIRGEVKVNPKKEFDQYQKLTFKESNGLQRTYKSDKIKGYGYEKTSFVSGEYEGEKVFFKLLSRGVLNLYEVQYEVLLMNELRTKTDYLMKKTSSEEYVRIKSGRIKKQLTDVMSDDAEFVKQLEARKDLEPENLKEVFNSYNSRALNN